MIMKHQKNPFKQWIFACSLLSIACSELRPPAPNNLEPIVRNSSPQKKREEVKKDPNNLDPQSWNERITNLKQSAENIAFDVNNTNTLVSKIFEIKSSLCQRQNELFSQCIAHTPLFPSTWRSAAVCRAEQRAWDNRTFKMKISGNSGKFRLVLDDVIESNVISPGELRHITWTISGNRNPTDIKLSDVGSFRLVAVEGEFPTLSEIQFSLLINDRVIFDENDLISESKTDTSISLNSLAVIELLNSTDCKVEEGEIDNITQAAIARAIFPSPIVIPNQSENTLDEAFATQLEDWIETQSRTLQNRGDVFLAVAQDISRLRRDLRGELQLGCWSRQKIKTVEISVKGAHLPLSDWDRAATKLQLPRVGNPTQTTIDFGAGLRFTNPDETNFALFRDESRWLLSTSGDLTIGDLSHVKVQKGGFQFKSFRNCWSTWGGLGTACEWQNRESDRYEFSALKVKVNDQIIYQRDGINHTFAKNSLGWIDENLTANGSYKELMKRRDCPVQ